jgi:hypothetical protein
MKRHESTSISTLTDPGRGKPAITPSLVSRDSSSFSKAVSNAIIFPRSPIAYFYRKQTAL